MKHSDFTICFAIFAATLIIVSDMRTNIITKMLLTKLSYNQILDTAVEDSLLSSIEADFYGNKFVLDKEQILDRLWKNLSYSFGTFNQDLAQERLLDCIPVIICTEMDGFYVWQYDEAEKKHKFGEKLPFLFEEDGYCFFLNFADFIKIEDKNTGTVIEGTFDYVIKYINTGLLEKREVFEEKKKQVITELVRDSLELAVEKNAVRQNIDAKYRISIPFIDYEEWYQNIQDVNLLLYFQGNPRKFYGKNYQRFIFSGARLSKNKKN